VPWPGEGTTISEMTVGELGGTLAALAAHCDGPVVFVGGPVTGDFVEPVYDVLSGLGPVERLDVVLCSGGGAVTAARQLALLIREYAQAVTIHVPRLARSAATLLCLSADEVVMGPVAELGPVDALVGGLGGGFEDVRAFPRMARDWFGVSQPQDALQVLALVAQRVFPVSLGGFYRGDAYLRQTAVELLTWQLPQAAPDELAAIAESLISGRLVHDDVITRRDAARLGLHVRHPAAGHEKALMNVSRAWDAERCAGVVAVVATEGGCAWLGRAEPRPDGEG
jgi:hypothetical protein